MKYIKNILKISIVLLLLLVCVGSIYASEDVHAVSSEDGDMDDFEVDDVDEDSDDIDDEELGDESDEDDFDDEDLGDESDEDDFDDEESDDDEDDLDEDDFDDEESDDDEDDLDEDDFDDEDLDDYEFSDFDYLKLKITFYLDRYGNCSYYDWTEIDEFLSEYQIYLANPDIYTLNESAEGYNTYLKIYDSIISTFGEYNLTENETDYLKFMVIFFLNHYGNVSANYTWNESESFSNYTFPYDFLLTTCCAVKGSATSEEYYDYLKYSYSPFYAIASNSTDVNQTYAANQTSIEVENPQEFNIFVFIIMLMLLIISMI